MSWLLRLTRVHFQAFPFTLPLKPPSTATIFSSNAAKDDTANGTMSSTSDGIDEMADSPPGEAGALSSAVGEVVRSSLRRRANLAFPGGMAKVRVSPSMSSSCDYKRALTDDDDEYTDLAIFLHQRPILSLPKDARVAEHIARLEQARLN